MRHCRLGDKFAATRTTDECASKPCPDMLLEIMVELDVSPGRTLMIGDTTHDLLLARNAGCAAMGVAYGAHAKSALLALQPLACVDTVADLANILIPPDGKH
jgi:phosphoglycolate phosphatase